MCLIVSRSATRRMKLGKGDLYCYKELDADYRSTVMRTVWPTSGYMTWSANWRKKPPITVRWDHPIIEEGLHAYTTRPSGVGIDCKVLLLRVKRCHILGADSKGCVAFKRAQVIRELTS